MVDGPPPGIVSAVPLPGDPPPVDALDALRRWVERNEPTRWDVPLPVTAPSRFANPADPLWFRIQFIYSPVVVTRPDTILKVTGI